MRQLFLFRHGKSAWDDHELRDYDRPLAPRGLKATPRMARFMLAQGLVPSLVICSGAERTRQTASLLLSEWGDAAPPIRYDDVIFDAMPAALFKLVTGVPEATVDPLMIVGHSPGLEMLATALLTSGDAGDLAEGEEERRRALTAKFPTAALAVLQCPVEAWSDLKPTSATLSHFQVPRALDHGSPSAQQ